MRLFTFGCSYTEYIWPTWSDILAHDLDCDEAHNYGKAGMGNQGIACRLVEANRKHSFQPEDIICIVWSSWTRVDLLKDDKWVTEGNILNSDYFSDEYLQKHWSEENDNIRNTTAILQGNAYVRQFTQNIFNGHINNVSKDLPGSNNIFPKTNCVYRDAHPSVLEHLNYVDKFVYPSLGYELQKHTLDWANSLDTTVAEIINNNSHLSNLELEDLILEKWEGRNSYV